MSLDTFYLIFRRYLKFHQLVNFELLNSEHSLPVRSAGKYCELSLQRLGEEKIRIRTNPSLDVLEFLSSESDPLLRVNCKWLPISRFEENKTNTKVYQEVHALKR